MLLTFPSGPVMMDDKELCRDIQLLIKPETSQGRLKYKTQKGEDVDLIVQGCTNPALVNMGTAEMSMFGIEGVKNIPFKLKLEFKVFKEQFRLYGSIGTDKVNFQSKSIITLALEVIKHMSHS